MKEKKNYSIFERDNILVISMNEKGTDGKFHSVSMKLPTYHTVVNEETGERKIVKMTRKQIVNSSLKRMSEFYK